MSVSVIYSAIPPSSTIYRRIQTEKVFSILVAYLFSYGCGIFHFCDEHEEDDEILEDIIERYQDTFGSTLEAEEIIAEFRSELMRTRQAYPEIENRTAMFEQSSVEIKKRLSQELSRMKVADANKIVERLMFGDKTLAPNFLSEEDSLGLISRDLVSQGARILRQIDPEMLFAKDEGWEELCLDHLKRWRTLYFSADEKNEEILVGID